jgi:hypothetical protein
MRAAALAFALAGPAAAQQVTPGVKPPLTVEKPAPEAAPIAPQRDEPEIVRRYRELLGPETTLSYAAVEPIDPARDAVRMRQVVLQRPDRRAEAAELILDGLRQDGVREAVLQDVRFGYTGRGGSATIERLRIVGLAVAQPPAGQPPTPDLVTIDSLRVETLSVQGEAAVAIASITMEEYGAGRTGRMAVEGLELRFADPRAAVDRISLRRLSLRGVDLAGSLTALMAQGRPPRSSGSSALEAEDLVLRQGDRAIGGLASLTATGEAPAPGAAGAETARILLRGISIHPFPAIRDWMQRFGYSALLGDLTADLSIDRQAGRMEIGSLALAAREIGALGFALAMDGLNFDDPSPETMRQGRLLSMRLRFVDQSLYGRFVRQQAQQMRRTEQQVRTMFAEQARAIFARPQGGGGGGGGPKDGGAATTEIGAAIQRFLRGEATEIEVAARPAKPVPFAELQALVPGGPDAVQQALGITVTTR